MKTRLLIILYTLLISSCSNKTYDEHPVKKDIKTNILVLTDLSESIHRPCTISLENSLSQIIKNLPENSHLEIYTISEDYYAKNWLKGETIGEIVGSDRKKNIKEKKDATNELDTLLNTQKERAPNNTCIYNSIARSDNRFKALQNDRQFEHRNILIILSDMVEQCDNSINRKPLHLNKMDISDKQQYLDSLKIELDMSYLNQVQFVSCTDAIHNNPTFPIGDQLQVFWANALSKLNIDRNNMSFGSEIQEIY
jgi:hypothetical protein